MTWQVSYDATADEGEIRFNPTDGSETPVGAYARIKFQHGPIGENGINGVQNEEVIDLLIVRLTALDERFPCDENKIAITNLKSAHEILRARTAKRQAQGVEGKNEAHVS